MRPGLAALVTAFTVLLAGCGSDSQPRLAHADAAQLIALTDRIAREGPCAQAHDIAGVSARAAQLVNRGRVPVELQRPLLDGVNALAAHAPACLQAVPTTAPVLRVKPGHEPHDHDHERGKHGHSD